MVYTYSRNSEAWMRLLVQLTDYSWYFPQSVESRESFTVFTHKLADMLIFLGDIWFQVK